jgi:predicted MFS family arabinose efflux permease
MTTITATEDPLDERTVSPCMILLLAAACGLTAANLYYAQPLAGPISAALGLSPKATGLIVTLTQVGYGAGLLFIVPLSDLIENRRLTLVMLGGCALALLVAGLSFHALPFLNAALFIGFGSVVVQVLIPYAAHMAPESARGRVVGNVMSGTMIGIMLARPVSSFLADLFSWHAVFLLAAGTMIVLAAVLSRALPQRVPTSKLRYGQLLASMGNLAATTPLLQRRALYQAFLGAAFSLFWTTTPPLLLAGPAFHLSQGGIALFALAGVAGAVAAPIAGRIADRGWSRPSTAVAMLAVAGAFLMTQIAPEGSKLALYLLVAAAILLDFGITANMALGQRMIFSLGAESRGRLNGLYVATFFVGCAIGSALGGWVYAQGGWTLTAWVGFASPIAALAYFTTELRQIRRRPDRSSFV